MPVLTAVAVSLIFYRMCRHAFVCYHGVFDRLEEKNNVLKKSIEEKEIIIQSLPDKRQRAAFLFKASRQLIELVTAEEIFDFLIHSFRDLFPQADAALLFEFDRENDTLALVRSFKPDNTIIKEKRGNLLDIWVLRQNRSLLIDDIARDFRFDSGSLESYSERAMRAFMVSPVSIANAIFGVARVESKETGRFSLEDSRLMRSICDLGAVVLERARLFKRAQDLAIRDPLTSFFMKDYFFKQLQRLCHYASQADKKLGLIMLDIDDFKQINDNYGHIVGDAVLRKISKILIANAGASGNIIARFGGDEFIIGIVDTNKQETVNLAESIRSAVEKSGLHFRRRTITFNLSVGAAVYPDDAKDAFEMVAVVDKFLYNAKSQGKNRVCYSG